MSAGIILPSLFSLATSASEALLFGTSNANFGGFSLPQIGIWTPPEYSQPAVTILTIAGTTDPNSGEPATNPVNYVFDAVMRLVHDRKLRKTSHPVLTGPNMSDHAYLEPARVTLEIGMSDCMSSYDDGVWVGASTKSISAWQIIKGFQQNKTLLQLTTRLDTYENMMVIQATAPDDVHTKVSLKATIILEELLAGTVLSIAPVSAVPQTSDITSQGVVQTNAPNISQTQQYVVPSTQYPDIQTYPQVPGAGFISGNSLSKFQVNTGTDIGNEGTP